MGEGGAATGAGEGGAEGREGRGGAGAESEAGGAARAGAAGAKEGAAAIEGGGEGGGEKEGTAWASGERREATDDSSGARSPSGLARREGPANGERIDTCVCRSPSCGVVVVRTAVEGRDKLYSRRLSSPFLGGVDPSLESELIGRGTDIVSIWPRNLVTPRPVVVSSQCVCVVIPFYVGESTTLRRIFSPGVAEEESRF